MSRAISREFPGFDIQIISQIESPDQTEMTYEVVLFKGKENYDVTFSAKGAVLKKEAGLPDDDRSVINIVSAIKISQPFQKVPDIIIRAASASRDTKVPLKNP
jgi:hypothetical protein